MAVNRCADCGSCKEGSVQKECPYCESTICSKCLEKQIEVYSWNGCAQCCIEYRHLLVH